MLNATPPAENSALEDVLDHTSVASGTSGDITSSHDDDLTLKPARLEDSRGGQARLSASSEPRREQRSFAPVHAAVLRAGRSA